MNNLIQKYLINKVCSCCQKYPMRMLLTLFIIEFLLFFGLYYLSLDLIGKYFFPSTHEMLEMVKKFDAADYVAISLGMIAYLLFKKERSFLVALTALFCICMATSSQLFALVPADIEIGDIFGRQTFVYFPMMLMFISFFGIAFNIVVLIFLSVGKRATEH
ncbi:hypothetical protein [Bacillus phage vB_BpuM-ZY1]|nr:hypothetical protein [Bacillus phage vB_BpuM-ZY1]